jgi:hypothetical protein
MKQHPLGHLRDGSHVRQLPLPPVTGSAGDYPGHGDPADGDQGDDRPP